MPELRLGALTQQKYLIKQSWRQSTNSRFNPTNLKMVLLLYLHLKMEYLFNIWRISYFISE